MKAVVIRDIMQFGIEEIPVPPVPPGGLLIRVEACGLCGSDLRTLRSGHRRIRFPWTIGHEVCGRVTQVGAGHKGTWKKGERLVVGPLVYCGCCDFCQDGRFDLCEHQKELGQHWPGGLAEYMAIPRESVERGNLLKAPESGDHSQNTAPEFLAVTEPLSSCVNAQESADITLGETVVIIGSGPIGCIHAALARIRGVGRVILCDINARRLQFAESFFPDRLVNAAEEDPVDAVMKETGGRGAEVVIAAAPAPAASVQAVEMAGKGGRVLQFGGLPKDDCRPGIDMNLVHYRGLSIIGTTTFAPRHNEIALELISSGVFPARKLVTHTFPLGDFVKGASMALEGKVLKGVFLP